jgi:serine/threonine protein kinase/outer membrane protein OmpA-like peptidoglycan-associated protein
MDAERWQRINDLFFATIALPVHEQSALLAKLCTDDPSLIDEVASLVAAHQQAAHFIESPAMSAGQLLDNVAARLMEGRRFGAYRILHKIGHGGMGAVYLATRDDQQYEKLVAIKIIKAGLDTALTLRQFYRERQILASLEHANIARLLDGGTTEEGLPYLVMEYVEGQTIDAYCDANRLTVVERLHLFLKVMAAVQFAHRNGVIHRDLKPANILVTGNAEPKLLDFGIARLLAHKPAALIGATTTNLPRMTPEYASPEEVRGQSVTAATDVYSLGIVLYELLSGRRPYQFGNRSHEEIFRAICETAPPKASASLHVAEEICVMSAGNQGTRLTVRRISELRGDQPQRLRRRLAGDLDNILLMAIRKEPQRRYPSVAEFAEDIRRYLAGLPVMARKDSLVYRGVKLVRRNRLRAAAASLVVASLATGALTTRWQAHVAALARIEAEKRMWETTREIQGAAERASRAEAEANHLREQSMEQENQGRMRLLQRLQQILDARDTARGLVINTSTLTFNAGRTGLGADVRERLARIAGALLEYPDLSVQVEGHSDGYGDDAYNQALSEERAQAVQAYLLTQGIARGIMSAKGFGSARPVASNVTEIGRQRNRRVEIVVSGSFIGKAPSAMDATGAARARMASSASVTRKSQAPSAILNLALNKPATGSPPCNAHEGPGRAVNGSTSGGNLDKWCSDILPSFLQVDLGETFSVASFILRHASAGGESADFNTRDFDIQVSINGTDFTTVVKVIGNTQGVTAHTIAPTLVRFVRLNITVPAQQPGVRLSRIYELEVYSSALSPSSLKSFLASDSSGQSAPPLR